MATPTNPERMETPGGAVAPMSPVSNWTRIGTMTLAAVTGSGNVVLPDDTTQTSNGFVSDGGTFIVLRSMYDQATTAVGQAAAGYLMGRKRGSGNGGWTLLYNKATAPSTLVTFVYNPGTTTGKDVNDGTFKYTTPASDHVFDAMGCNEFVWLTTQAIGTLTGGSTSNTGVQFRVI